MMRKELVFAAVVVALALPVHARTWTSADGSKTFEGDLRSYDAASGEVTVVMAGGRVLTFTQDKLSEDDIAFLKEQPAVDGPGAAAVDPTEALAAQVVGAKVAKAKLHRLEGKRFKRAEMATAPEYYILYFSASW